MNEIKYIHPEHYLVLHLFSFSQKDTKGNKNSEAKASHQKPRIVTKNCNRKAQKERWISLFKKKKKKKMVYDGKGLLDQ